MEPEWNQNDESGAPWGIRTSDLQIRSLSLYPAELRARHAAGEMPILTTPSGSVKRGVHVLESPPGGTMPKAMFGRPRGGRVGKLAAGALRPSDGTARRGAFSRRPRFPVRAAGRDVRRAFVGRPTFLSRCDKTVAGCRRGRCKSRHHGRQRKRVLAAGAGLGSAGAQADR